jgi:hypothetical protein
MNLRILRKIEALQRGETITTSEKGNSMVPLIHSGQEHKLEPAVWWDCDKGDIVFCKVNGVYYTHKVLAKNKDQGLQIGNNRGGVNGWTKTVFGKVTEVL